MAEKNGGPAFPGFDPNSEAPKPTEGMSLRDYFAGQALVGICANSYTPWAPDAADIADSDLAKAAYDLADAMLAASQSDEVSDAGR